MSSSSVLPSAPLSRPYSLGLRPCPGSSGCLGLPMVLNSLGRAGRWYDGVPELAHALEALTFAPVDRQQAVLLVLVGWLHQVKGMGTGVTSSQVSFAPPNVHLAPEASIVKKRHERRRFDQLVDWHDQLVCLQGLSGWHHRQAARLLQLELAR
jgi:hypothetical protein